jgi:CheY-like chemotaxis protein
MDGMEATKLIRETGYNHPVVALTANAVAGQADVFLRNGFDEFISKPIDIRQLNNVLNKQIRDKKPPEVVDAARRQADKARRQVITEQQMASVHGAVGHHDENGKESWLTDSTIDGLDVAKGLQRYGGDETVYIKILRSYSASVRTMLADVKAVSEETLLDYKVKIHGIKGASFDLFAGQVGQKAKMLEDAADSGDLAFIENHNPSFLAAAWKLIANIDYLLAAIDAEIQKPVKDKPDVVVLTTLLDSCRIFNIEGVENAMAEIELYRYEQDDGLGLWLRENVDMMNFSQIVEKLSEILS